MSTRKIATSTLWQIASQITMAALSILTVKFVAMGLSKELAGNYNSAYGFLQLFGILADFGLYAVAVREVSRAPIKNYFEEQDTKPDKQISNREEVLGAIIILRCITLLISLSSALLFIWFIPIWKGTPLPLSVTIASLVPFFTLLAGIIRTVFQINYKMHFVFIAEVTQKIITVIFIGIFIMLGVRGSHDLHILHLFLFIGGIGAFFLFFISLTYGNRLMIIRPHWNSKLLKRLACSAAPFGAAYFFMALYRQFDVTLIALLRPDFELQNAYYGFVLRMADMGFLIPTFLLNSTLPVLSERDAKGEDTRNLLGKTFLIILILGSISLLFSVLWSRPLIQLLTTDAYLSTPFRPGSDTALRLIGFPIFLNGIVLFGFYVLLTKFKWKRLVGILMLGVIISLSLNLWIIPIQGFVGAAKVSIIVHTFLAILLFRESIRTMPMQLKWQYLIRWGVFSLIIAGIMKISEPLLVNEISTIIGIAIMSLFIVLIAWGIGLIKALM